MFTVYLAWVAWRHRATYSGRRRCACRGRASGMVCHLTRPHFPKWEHRTAAIARRSSI